MVVLILGVLGIFGFGFALGIYWPNKHEIAFMSGRVVDEDDCCPPTKSESQLPLTQSAESYDVASASVTNESSTVNLKNMKMKPESSSVMKIKSATNKIHPELPTDVIYSKVWIGDDFWLDRQMDSPTFVFNVIFLFL